MSGVPAFIGFAEPSGGGDGRVSAVAIERWDSREFFKRVVPAAQGYLSGAVRGFFANGGRRCVVLAVPPPCGSSGLVRVLQRGGPLEDRADIDLICIPDAFSPLVHDAGGRSEIHAAALAHCELMGERFAILDAPPRFNSLKMQDAVDEVLWLSSSLRSAFGAVYFPWIVVDQSSDGRVSPIRPVGGQAWRCLPAPVRRGDSGSKVFIPPCGHVAGLFARLDALVGPHLSPANELLEDVVDASMDIDALEHARLNEGGVNCLRSLRGRGIAVGGARTLSGHSRWTYIATARVILNFRRWVAVGMRDFVFEPQSTQLWEAIRTRLVSHCLDLQAAGALAGSESGEAFFVKCDGETNPPGGRELGQVVAHVGLAPSIPAEFIVVRIVHDASGFTSSGLIG
jgi:uncharacterized protein